MAFDLKSAKPVGGGFDLSTAKPVEPIQVETPPEKDSGGLIGEGLGLAETAGTIVSGMVAEPISGLAGLVSIPFVGAENAGDVVRDVQQKMTFEPSTPEGQRNLAKIGQFLGPINELLEKAKQISGDVGFDLAGPIGGAIGATIPEALLELVPAYKAPKVGAKAIAKKGAKLGEKGADLIGEAADLKKSLMAEDGDLAKAATIVSKGKEGDLIELIAPDKEFYKAADELGITVEPLASYASQNPQFRSIEQGLAAIPGNMLEPQGQAFIAELSKKADDLITEYGGSLDKADVSQNFRSSALQTVTDLTNQADDLYDKIGEAIPKTARVKADNTVNLLNSIKTELNGKLPPKLQGILDDLTPKQSGVEFNVVTGAKKGAEKLPTHELLNQRRREIGQAIGRNSGPFKDAEVGQLKRIYAAMTSDQDLVAESFDLLDASKTAKGLVSQRKQLEDNLVKLLGKDLGDSITSKVGRSIKKLGVGDLSDFDRIMDAVPKANRQEIVLTALNDIFRGRGAGKNALDVTQFSKFMDELNRQPTIKSRLYAELPEESRKALNNLHRVSRGVSLALKDKVRTGVIHEMFNEKTGFVRKLAGAGVQMAAGKLAGGGALGTASGMVVGDFLKQSSGRARATADLLATPQFQNMIKDAVSSGAIEGGQVSRKMQAAEKVLARSEQYQKWAKTLDQSDAAKLASMGFVSYLFGEEEE